MASRALSLPEQCPRLAESAQPVHSGGLLPQTNALRHRWTIDYLISAYTDPVTKLFRSQRFGLLVLWTAVIICITTMPWNNFKGHAHWSRVRWVPFHDDPLVFF